MESKESSNVLKGGNLPEEKRDFKKSALSKKNSERKVKEPRAVIYAGPSVPGGILASGKIYKKIPEYVLDFISKNPVIGNLLIDVEKLAEFKRKAEIRGTKEYMLYYQALKVIDEGGIM